MSDTVRAILWGGALCGVMDATAATATFAMRGVAPKRVWQNVASGLLGGRSFEQGWKTGALGLLLHFVIAFSAATVFCVAALSMPGLLRFPVIAGAVYGVVVFVVMNLVVLPLSAMPKRQSSTAVIVTQLIIHVVCVGLPISLVASSMQAR
jgi:hypothetical protein